MLKLPVVSSRVAVPSPLPATPVDFAPSPTLRDRFGRTYTYLRLSVTDRCDLACLYCMPPLGEREHGSRAELLSFDEIVRVVRVFSSVGIRRVRLTGGEPLVRKDIVRLVERVRSGTDVSEIALTTNATRLAELARDLHAAGATAVNVSLDTLRADRFEAITRGGKLSEVLAGIHAALDAGLRVKINTIPMRGFNDDELVDVVRFAWRIGATPRFIELMPLGEAAKLGTEAVVGVREIVHALSEIIDADQHAEQVNDAGPARYFRARETDSNRVGVISAVTNEFCDSCNRVRLTAQGQIRACLASRSTVSLRDVLRGGGDDRDLLWAIEYALAAKSISHYFTDRAVTEHEHVGMSLIGG